MMEPVQVGHLLIFCLFFSTWFWNTKTTPTQGLIREQGNNRVCFLVLASVEHIVLIGSQLAAKWQELGPIQTLVLFLGAKWTREARFIASSFFHVRNTSSQWCLNAALQQHLLLFVTGTPWWGHKKKTLITRDPDWRDSKQIILQHKKGHLFNLSFVWFCLCCYLHFWIDLPPDSKNEFSTSVTSYLVAPAVLWLLYLEPSLSILPIPESDT